MLRLPHQRRAVLLHGDVRGHRIWAAAAATAMFGSILLSRFGTVGTADTIGMLCTIPIALLAVAFGAWGGLMGSVVGIGFLQVWVSIADVSLSPLGWTARSIPLLLVGVLLGVVVDRLRHSDDERQRLAAAAARHRETVEINDTIIQQLSAAKWSLESGNTEDALTILSDTVELGHQFVSDLIRDNDASHTWIGSSGEQT